MIDRFSITISTWQKKNSKTVQTTQLWAEGKYDPPPPPQPSANPCIGRPSSQWHKKSQNKSKFKAMKMVLSEVRGL